MSEHKVEIYVEPDTGDFFVRGLTGTLLHVLPAGTDLALAGLSLAGQWQRMEGEWGKRGGMFVRAFITDSER